MIRGKVLYRLNGYVVVKENDEIFIVKRVKYKKDVRRQRVTFNSVHHYLIGVNYLLHADKNTLKIFSKLYKFINNYKNLHG